MNFDRYAIHYLCFIMLCFWTRNHMALGMFTNLCLVLLLLIAGSLVPKFHFQLTKESYGEVWEWADTVQVGIWSDSFNSVFYTLIKNYLLTKENAHYDQTLWKICFTSCNAVAVLFFSYKLTKCVFMLFWIHNLLHMTGGHNSLTTQF